MKNENNDSLDDSMDDDDEKTTVVKRSDKLKGNEDTRIISSSKKDEVEHKPSEQKLKLRENVELLGIGKFLLDKGFLSSMQQIEKILNEQDVLNFGVPKRSRRLFVEVAVDLGYVSHESLTEIFHDFFKVDIIDSSDKIVSAYQNIPNKDKKLFTKEIIEKYLFLPFAIDEKNVTIACSNPGDLEDLDDISLFCERKVYAKYADLGDINNAIQQIFITHIDVEADVTLEETDYDDFDLNALTKYPVVEIVNYLLHKALHDNASDIHFEPGESFCLVRNRIFGMLHEVIHLPKSKSPEITSRIKIMSEMNVAERRLPQDGRFSRFISGRKVDFRASTFPTLHGEKIVLRLLVKEQLKTNIDMLGLEASELEMFKDKINAPYGMVLLTGPTGSGKTTTLYSGLSYIDKKQKNVLTIEDPVEYQLDGVHQMQANQKIGLTFASGLKTMLRQDPDIIMVGEIRDIETGAIAVRASLTGHVVFTTLHTNDAVGTIFRLIDMGVERFLVASALTVAIAQRLVRTVCDECAVGRDATFILRQLADYGVDEDKLNSMGLKISKHREYMVGRGCNKCKGSGYFGRRPIFEVFEMTQDIRNMILEKATSDKIKDQAISNGMTTLLKAGRKAIDEQFAVETTLPNGEIEREVIYNYTTFQEIIRVCGEES